MALRQSVRQQIEAAASVPGPCDHQFAVNGDAALVLDRGREPSGIWISRMCRHGEPEFRGPNRRQLSPAGATILRAEDTIVVLAPHDLRMRGAARKPMNVLHDRLLAALGRHVLRV